MRAWVSQAGRPGAAWLCVGLLGLLVLPDFIGPFYTRLLTELWILSLFALGFNFLFGYTGLLSFGQAAYFALGAYVTALLLKAHVGFPLALAAAVAVAAGAAVVIGALCVGRDEIYFAMVTLAFGQLVYAVAWQWLSLTGGADGITGIPRPAFSLAGVRVEIASFSAYYRLTLVAGTAVAFGLWHLVRSRFGLSLQGIREDAQRALFLGIPVWRFKLAAFVVSAATSGLSGALFAPFAGVVQPGAAHWLKSAEPVVMTLIGGSSAFAGPVLGAFFYVILKEVVGTRTEFWPLVVGAVVAVMVIVAPDGIAGRLNDLAGRAAGLARRLPLGRPLATTVATAGATAPPAVVGRRGEDGLDSAREGS